MTLDDLMAMDRRALRQVIDQGSPLDPATLAERMYLGVDLSLPNFARKLLWHTFRKTFHRDGEQVRGWNVRMEQNGIDGPRRPLVDRRGRPITFGHYRIRERGEARFPGGWTGAHFLDYGVAGNTFLDLARFGYTPLVAVNAGSQDLLLGWEVFKIGPAFLPLPLFWALRYEGPLDEVIPPPRAPR